MWIIMAHVRKLGSFKKWNWVSNRIGVCRDSFFYKTMKPSKCQFLIIVQVKRQVYSLFLTTYFSVWDSFSFILSKSE